MPGVLYQPFPMLARSRAQVWTYAPNYRRPRHFHAEPELNVIAGGSATFRVGGRVLTLGAGDVLGFAPGQDHELVGGSRDLVLFAIGLRRELGNDVLRRSPTALLEPFQARLQADALRELVRHCASSTGQAGADGAVAELWERTQAACRRDRVSASHALTRRALAALNRAPELDREQLASETRACVSEVGRYFQRDLGLTLVAYRARVRLLRFVERVDAGSSFTAAALDAGFGSYSQCHRVFSDAFACTPREFFQPAKRRRIEDAFAPVEELALGPF